jgi:hypothetical protein
MKASIWTPANMIFTYGKAWNYKTAEDGDIVIEVHAAIDTRARYLTSRLIHTPLESFSP